MPAFDNYTVTEEESFAEGRESGHRWTKEDWLPGGPWVPSSWTAFRDEKWIEYCRRCRANNRAYLRGFALGLTELHRVPYVRLALSQCGFASVPDDEILRTIIMEGGYMAANDPDAVERQKEAEGIVRARREKSRLLLRIKV